MRLRNQPRAWLGRDGNLGPVKSQSCGEHELWRLKLGGGGFAQDNSCVVLGALSLASRGHHWLEVFSVELRGGVGRTPERQASQGGPRAPDVPPVWGFGELTLSSGSTLQAEMALSRSSFSS